MNKCFYCERPIAKATILNPLPELLETIDHIIPLSKGGNNSAVNKIKSCLQCNNLKNNSLPEHFILRLQRMLDLGRIEQNKYRHYPFNLIPTVIKNTELLINNRVNIKRKDMYKNVIEPKKKEIKKKKQEVEFVYVEDIWTKDRFDIFFAGKQHFHYL